MARTSARGARPARRRHRSLLALLAMLLVAIVVTPVVAAQADTAGGSGTTGSVAGAPTIGSDQADYPPGSTVVLSGSNWLPNDTVVVNVDDDQGKSWQKDVGVHTTSTGDLTYTFTLPKTFVAQYNVSATGSDGRTATSSFTDANSAADLDQCRNGPKSAPVVCTGGAWVNGNANAIQAHYLEGDSIVYRMQFDNLALTSHTVTIEWDTTQNGKHALDYLTTYNRTEVGAAPCSGVAGCGAATTFPIPVDPFVAAEGVSQIPGVFTMFNGTITGVSAYTRAGSFDGNSQTSITLAFTSANATPVLAWSVHISTRADWGFDNSAVAISGSPYHVRLLDLDGQGGNQDRSLSTDAVVFPATITIVKDALPDDPTSFPFTASGAEMSPASFTLVDDGVHPALRTRSFTNLVTFGGSRTVAEGALPTGWALTDVNCSITTPVGTKLGTVTPDGNGAGPAATFGLEEANAATCTFTNQFTRGNTTTATAIHVSGDHTTAVTAVPLGSTVHDSATVSGTGFGTPTGDVSFAWYAANDSCTGTPAGAGTMTLVNVVADPSTSFGPLAAGSYSFQAGYGGDSNYDTSEAPCEPLHVNKADTTVATSIHAGDDHATAVTSVTLGSRVHDSATVSGTAFGAPTGDVTFTWYTTANDCTGPSTDAGTVTLVGGVAHPSTSFGPLPAGSYSFRAHYGGDTNYNESDADCEPLRVTKADTTTVTAIHAGDDHATPVTSVPLGSSVHDRATVSGTPFATPTGDVFFRWFTNGVCDGEGVAAGVVPLSSGIADSSATESALAAGSYSFEATYDGDANYRPSVGACEPLTVDKGDAGARTTIHDASHHAVTSVERGASVHDEALVSGTSFGMPTGTVSFRWFSNGTCTGDGAVSGTVDVVDGVAHASKTVTPDAAGEHSFRATYSGDANYRAADALCEPLTVTAVDLAISKTDNGARPVAGQGTFTYTLAVDNLGPSDATDDATVVDVLPSEIEFVSFGTLGDGVTCDPPSGRSLTCSIAKNLLAVGDPPVPILVVVRVAAGTTVAEITNVAIVTSPDDEAPCDVSATGITCNPADTNNFASVTTPLTAVAGTVTEARSPGLAFTGSEAGRLSILGLVLLALGGCCLSGSRRRRARAR